MQPNGQKTAFFFLDHKIVKVVNQSADYPMQFMLVFMKSRSRSLAKMNGSIPGNLL